MTQIVVERALERPEALKYVQDRLRHGHSLARYLLQRSDLSKGRITTFLPRDLKEDELYKFDTGKLYPLPTLENDENDHRGRVEEVPDTDPYLIAAISAFLEQGPDRIGLLEERNATPDSPWVSKKSGLRNVAYENELYYGLLSSDSADQKIIAESVVGASSWLVIGVLSSLTPVPRWPIGPGVGAAVDEATLKGIAERAGKIIVGAYDQESYLILTFP